MTIKYISKHVKDSKGNVLATIVATGRDNIGMSIRAPNDKNKREVGTSLALSRSVIKPIKITGYKAEPVKENNNLEKVNMAITADEVDFQMKVPNRASHFFDKVLLIDYLCMEVLFMQERANRYFK